MAEDRKSVLDRIGDDEGCEFYRKCINCPFYFCVKNAIEGIKEYAEAILADMPTPKG